MDASAPYGEVHAEPYVELLGEPAVRVASGSLLFRRDKRYYLLAFLAWHRDWVPRERLATLFWPEHDPADARHNLRQLLKRTRRLAWQPALEMSMDRGAQRVRWLPATDLAALTHALATRAWERALQVYRGPLLAGFTCDAVPEFADWLVFERRQLRERWRTAVLAHAADLGANGDHRLAARVLASVLRQDEYDEDALRAFMTASSMAGNVKQALDAHRAFAQRLEAELQIMPSSATQALLLRIREGRLVAATVPGSRQNLQTVAEPNAALTTFVTPDTARRTVAGPDAAVSTVAEANAAPGTLHEPTAAPRTEPEPNVAPGTLHEPNVAPGTLHEPNVAPGTLHEAKAAPRTRLEPKATLIDERLTPPTPPLVGREQELRDLYHQLANPACRLLTVTGPGGVGKSRIARHAVIELRSRYEDGAVFVALEGLPATGSPADAIASALGLAAPDQADLEPLEHVVRSVGNKHLLLVLDNIEHLTGAGRVAAHLVASCPRLDLLTTSRERLDLAEEWLLPIEGLPYPPRSATLSEALTYDAMQLFVQRAERVRPGFCLGPDDLAYVLDICRLVAGLPLGIEMAAAWLRLLACSDVAQEIERDTDFLDRSPNNVAERHRSIRATFEYSWRRLSRAEQAALGAVAVFRGAFDRAAGEHVAGTKLAVLAALVDRSLLRTHGEARFSVHPLLRQYALEKLSAAPSEERRAQAAHSRYFLRLLRVSPDTGGGLRRAGAELEAAFEDLAAAWRWSCAERRLDELGQAAAELARLCADRARHHDGLALLTSAVQATGAGASVARGRLLVERAQIEERLGRYREAALDARCGLDLLLEAEDRPGQLSGMTTLGKVALRGGRYAESREVFTKALSAARDWGMPWEVAQLSSNVGVAEQFLGRRARAAVWYRRSLALRRDLDDLPGVVTALANLGNVQRLLGHAEVARGLLDEALALAERIQAHEILPNLHINLGILVLDQDRPQSAAQHFASALQLARRLGNRNLEINAIFQQGKLAVTLGEAFPAQAAFLGSLRLADAIGQREKVLDSVVGLAWSRALHGDAGRAARWLQVGLEHPAASPGTKRWAEELRQALEPGAAIAQRARPADRRVANASDGPAVARAVATALARAGDAVPADGTALGAGAASGPGSVWEVDPASGGSSTSGTDPAFEVDPASGADTASRVAPGLEVDLELGVDTASATDPGFEAAPASRADPT